MTPGGAGAVSDVHFYPAPMAFQLKDFTQVQASVFQVARAPGQQHCLPGLCLADPGRFCHAVRARAPGLVLAERSCGRRRGARWRCRATARPWTADREFDAAQGAALEDTSMNTATTTLSLHDRLFLAPQLVRLALCRARGRRRRVCVRALRRLHGRLREGHPDRRGAGRDLARLVLAAVACADAGCRRILVAGHRALRRAAWRAADERVLAQVLPVEPVGHPVDERAVLHEHGRSTGSACSRARQGDGHGAHRLAPGLGRRRHGA